MEKKIVEFKLRNEKFAFDIMRVVEIIRLKDITPVPTAPEFIEGVINLRGKIIPIIDLRKRFKLESQNRDKEYRIIIVEHTETQVVGVIVDGVTHVLTINEEEIMPPPSTLVSVGGKYIEAIIQRNEEIIVFLDIEKVFSQEEQENLQSIAGMEVGASEESLNS